VIGRFLSADSIVPGAYDPQDLNRYAYARNNPLKYSDPDGHLPALAVPVAIAAFEYAASSAIGASIGVVVGGWLSDRFLNSTDDALDVDQGDNTQPQSDGQTTENEDGPYGHLKDHPSVGPGKDFTQAQKRKIREENRKRNGGILLDDETGEELVEPQQSVKGVTPPDNEAQIDHNWPKSKDGSNSYNNARVRSRANNIAKSDSDPRKLDGHGNVRGL
jgi:hypothetical protein